jgi:putative PEP-CTERM system histidine kinase
VIDILSNPMVWHAGGAAAFSLLGVYVLVTGAGGLLNKHIVALAAVGCAWCVYFALRSPFAGGYRLDLLSFAFEIAFMLSLFALLYYLLRGPYRQSMPETVRRSLYLFWVVILVIAGLVTWGLYADDSGPRAASYYHVSILSVALACFALAAQLNRDAPVEDRATLRALAAVGGILSGAQILTFGVAALTGAVPLSIVILRIAAVTVAVAIAFFAARRKPQWSLEIFVSPQGRAYLPRFLTMLLALLALLVMMPFFRSMPIHEAQPLAALLIVVTGVPAAVFLFSENLSARLRVFISKHFLPFRFDYREEWLRLIDTLASPEQSMPLPERAIKAVAQIVSAPAGLLWLCPEQAKPYACAASWNTRSLPEAEVAANDPALAFMRERQWILDTAELARDPEMYEGLRRPAWMEHLPDALLVVPLISNEELLGFVVLFQSSSAFRLTFEEIDLLRTSGRQVAVHLAQYQADKQLAEAQQFEAFNRLTAFVMHDLKNLIAQQSLMVKNAAKHKGNPDFFEDAMATIENSVARMNKLLRQLQSGDTAGPRERVGLSEALKDAIGKVEARNPEPSFENKGGTLVAQLDRERFTAVITHLIRNAQEATPADGSVAVRLQERQGSAEISIQDDGCGMQAEFVRKRLFRPFDSTKGSQGMGIGAYQARTFVVESGGSLEVESEVGLGTNVLIRLPLATS